MKRPDNKQDRIRLVLEAVTATPGITVADMAHQLRITVRCADNWTGEASRAGLIGWASNLQKKRGWFPAAMVQQARADANERRIQRKNESRRVDRLIARENRPKRAPALPRPHIDPGDVPMVHRMVPATAPLPFRVKAPASVFHQGGKS